MNTILWNDNLRRQGVDRYMKVFEGSDDFDLFIPYLFKESALGRQLGSEDDNASEVSDR